MKWQHINAKIEICSRLTWIYVLPWVYRLHTIVERERGGNEFLFYIFVFVVFGKIETRFIKLFIDVANFVMKVPENLLSHRCRSFRMEFIWRKKKMIEFFTFR